MVSSYPKRKGPVMMKRKEKKYILYFAFFITLFITLVRGVAETSFLQGFQARLINVRLPYRVPIKECSFNKLHSFLSNKKLSANRRNKTKHYTQYHIQYCRQVCTVPQHFNCIKGERGERCESAADPDSQKQQEPRIELYVSKCICGNYTNQKCANDVDANGRDWNQPHQIPGN